MTMARIDANAMGARGTQRRTGPRGTTGAVVGTVTPRTMRVHAHASNKAVAAAASSASGHTGLNVIAADPAVSTTNVRRIHADVRSGGSARHHPARAAPW